MDIFKRNIGAISGEEQKVLSQKRVFIAGCGGLGGFAAEFAARIGIGEIVLCDMDVFEVTNLNRQRFSDIYALGKNKAQQARTKLLDINPAARFVAYEQRITDDNAQALMKGCDVIVDALDNVEGRLVLERAAEELSIPLIFGAVEGWCGQISTVMAGDRTVSRLYKNANPKKAPSVTAMTVAMAASIQMTEAVNVLLGRPALQNKLLAFDLSDCSFEVLNN